MTECVSCFNGACPEIVPVTITENTYNIDSAAITITVTQDSATQVTLGFASDVADYLNLFCYFVDNPVAPGSKTISPPPTPGWIEYTLTTDADGTASLVVSNTGATDTWYLVVQGVNGVLVISDAITIGV